MVNANYLPAFLWEDLIKRALEEDLGQGGDLTTYVLGLEEKVFEGFLVSRQDGVLCGVEGLKQTFPLLDSRAEVALYKDDGDVIHKGDKIASVRGPACSLLIGERTALNIVCQLSGVATMTRRIVDSLKETKTRVAATRKTYPGLRAFQKYAVSVGGGTSHRFRLDDAVLIKDNHVALFGNDIGKLLHVARQNVGHMTKIELEVDTLEQLQQALDSEGADIYLLDNMSPDTLCKAVALINGRATSEASGGITPENAADVAKTGVDVISLGWLTQNLTPLDIGFDIMDKS